MSRDQSGSCDAGPSTERLSTPSPPRQNRSFANLSRLLQIAGIFSSTSLNDKDLPYPGADEEDDDDDEPSGEGAAEADQLDEESLMWDAQTALIAHQPALAMDRYRIAALPPYRAPTACLALGNLMTRGTGFTASTAGSPTAEYPETPYLGKGKGREVETPNRDLQESSGSGTGMTRFFTSIFTSSSLPSAQTATPTSPPEKKFDLVGNGWAIRKEGKRAVRDVEEMGIAGGWFVLGIGWILDREIERQSSHTQRQPIVGPVPISQHLSDDSEYRTREDDTADHEDHLVMFSKSKGRSSTHTPVPRPSIIRNRTSDGDTSTLGTTTDSTYPSTVNLSLSHGTDTTPSASDSHTTAVGSDNSKSPTTTNLKDTLETLKLLYDLLQPLLSLYRHGHIQATDPVYLPPITSSQLPSVLKPNGDLQKRRNAWALGGVVANQLLITKDIQSVAGDIGESRAAREIQQMGLGVAIVANYITGMTTSDIPSRENHFRTIVNHGPCGLKMADELVHQAAKRLDIIARTPSEPPTPASQFSKEAYPFPQMTPAKRKSKQQRHHSGDLNSGGRSHSRPRSSLTVPTPQPRRRRSSRSSVNSVDSLGIAPSPGKASTSSTTLVAEPSAPLIESPVKPTSAVEMLRRVSAGSPKSLAMSLSNSRHRTSASIVSTASTAGSTFPSPLKSVQSSTGLATELASPTRNASSPRRPSAADTLRNVESQQLDSVDEVNVQWPSLTGWVMRKSPPPPEQQSQLSPILPVNNTVVEEQTPGKHISFEKQRGPSSTAFRAVASSPDISNGLRLSTHPVHRSISSLQTSSKASSASLLCHDQDLAAMDPTLAAAELASALTKHVACSVCAVKGINFPECRKCGMRFCSRDCRVGERGAGNGKRHLCGVWETRQRDKELENVNVVADHLAGRTPTASPVRVY